MRGKKVLTRIPVFTVPYFIRPCFPERGGRLTAELPGRLLFGFVISTFVEKLM